MLRDQSETQTSMACLQSDLICQFNNSDSNVDSAKIIEQTNSSNQFLWFELFLILKTSEEWKQAIFQNLDHLFISEKRLNMVKQIDPLFKSLITNFHSRNCLKAISTILDLSTIKINQYKFMYHKFTLRTAVKMLIRESLY